MADETNLRAAGEENWGKPCPECGKPALQRASLYDKPGDETINTSTDTPAGEVFVHEGGVKCVRLSAGYREKMGLASVAR